MIRYRLVDSLDNTLLYEYRPDGTGSAGIVSINTTTGETKIMLVSEDDIGTRYAHKVLLRLSEFYRIGDYRTSGIIAWH